jgi:hypothetical protein
MYEALQERRGGGNDLYIIWTVGEQNFIVYSLLMTRLNQLPFDHISIFRPSPPFFLGGGETSFHNFFPFPPFSFSFFPGSSSCKLQGRFRGSPLVFSYTQNLSVHRSRYCCSVGVKGGVAGVDNKNEKKKKKKKEKRKKENRN